ncbi:hypothetical protein [Natronobacterium gregoryi]|uniref:Uncharacterized protein n=2 Tax=Natronobacterium gregoryi TaxID=44930 RepID=L0AM35_NATGS|nr:hypothetical protein [Natronobacterium gregoryi]AFZ74861.1 hypothetical protein Natgr_3758 [Natronobacterium gregoryi SP2]ELY73279.1 hypothetical protein C490_01692 [Natronobacterium gregoryi SP2]PLK19315.1 hypothetical protein CYV19_15485 [Natronobacterium gregoryi SP2]SFJ53804.1 hypothetical protein SAMN05443661_13731 [Natronobacterium gregoryi]
MSDDRSQRDDEDDGLATGGISTGGGPQRVVSDGSVDDILESLDEPEADADSSPAMEPGDEIESNESDETGEDGSSEVDSDTGSSIQLGSAISSEADGSDTPPTGSGKQASASSQDSTADPDELAARIESGDVTGADVRAAEAGEGRESTPEIDEVDLSLDDLDVGDGSKSETSDSDATSPLAGSVGLADGTDDQMPEAADSQTAETNDETAGLLDRLTRLFSR